MLNHTRTLLLNKEVTDIPSGLLTTYITPDFRKLIIPNVLKRIYDILFPPGFDSIACQSLVDTLTPILHQPELQPYTLKFDSRLSYDPYVKDSALILEPGVALSFSPNAACDIEPKYRLASQNYPSIPGLSGLHIVNVQKVNEITIKLISNRGWTKQQQIADRIGTLSREFILVPDYFFGSMDLPSKIITGQFLLSYSIVVKPKLIIPELITQYSTLFANQEVLQTVFKPVDGYEDDIVALRTTWLESQESTLRIGSLLLAYVYQLNSLLVK